MCVCELTDSHATSIPLTHSQAEIAIGWKDKRKKKGRKDERKKVKKSKAGKSSTTKKIAAGLF